jgi:hypothetical protein
VSYNAREVPVKPAGGAYGDRPVQAPPEVSVVRSIARMPEVVCTRFHYRDAGRSTNDDRMPMWGSRRLPSAAALSVR